MLHNLQWLFLMKKIVCVSLFHVLNPNAKCYSRMMSPVRLLG